jgi:hypothetical protein
MGAHHRQTTFFWFVPPCPPPSRHQAAVELSSESEYSSDEEIVCLSDLAVRASFWAGRVGTTVGGGGIPRLRFRGCVIRRLR